MAKGTVEAPTQNGTSMEKKPRKTRQPESPVTRLLRSKDVKEFLLDLDQNQQDAVEDFIMKANGRGKS